MGVKTKTSFKPGQIGNPYGRPKKGQTLTDLLLTHLSECEPGEAITRKQKFIEICYAEAMKGDTTMKKYIWDRMDGTPTQKTENVNLNLPKVIKVGVYDEDSPDTEDEDVVGSEDEVQSS